MTIEGCDFHPAGKCGSETEPERFSYLKRKCRRAYCGAPALSASILRPRQIKLGRSQSHDLPRKQNGLVDRLRHLTAQTFASDVVGAEMLPSVNPAQSRLLRRR